MNQPRDLAPLIGRMVVNGETLEGEKLADYLQQMPYDDFVSLMEDRILVGLDTPNDQAQRRPDSATPSATKGNK